MCLRVCQIKNITNLKIDWVYSCRLKYVHRVALATKQKNCTQMTNSKIKTFYFLKFITYSQSFYFNSTQEEEMLM